MKKAILKKYAIRTLAALILHFIIKIFDQTFKGKLLVFDSRGILFMIFIVVFVLLVWGIGDLIYKYSINRLLRKYDIIKQFKYLLVILTIYGLVVMVLFTVSYSLFDLILFHLPHYGNPTRYFDFDANLGMFAGYMGVLIFNGQIYMFNHWKKEKLMSEQLQKENIQAKYEALKNQIDPHFFFNNLSVLTKLLYKNQDLAAEYINQLSKIYRYILDKRDEILVTLKEELIFLDSYFFLIKIRHEEHILFKAELSEKTKGECYLPPNTLQMLIENAIKHNQFTAGEPLEISIAEDENSLIITNTLKKRNILEQTSGIGLDNIRTRYELLGSASVKVEETDHNFIVTLPKLGKK